MGDDRTLEKIDTLVVGGGQAGIAMSEHLTACGVPHLVIERGRVAERWRSERWDSLVANGPAWHDRFPAMEFANIQPDGFAPKDAVADYFESYARHIAAPIRCGIEVLSAKRRDNGLGFAITTSTGTIIARNVVAATGAFQVPNVPKMIPTEVGILQIHSSAYKNPSQICDGAVLVIGAGSSGVQIAEELLRSGRKVYLSVGPHERPPRAYRGRDFCWWLGVLGKWDLETPEAGAEHVTIAVSGSNGGHTIDFRKLAAAGITLTGSTTSYADGRIGFADDLRQNLNQGDKSYLSLLNEADEYVTQTGLNFPEDQAARFIAPDPECVTSPLGQIDLRKEEIRTVIWATGFSSDYSWLESSALDDRGRPSHRRGVSTAPGIYFLGLPWQSRRGSSFIWGVWHDAKHIADRIATTRKYLELL